MTYQEFNRRIFQFYQARSTTSFCILSITKKEFEDIIPISEVANFTELQYRWDNLLQSRDDLPQYFGLLAIQCLAASFMHRDKLNAEDAYKIRLCEILQLTDNQNLHTLFKGDSTAGPIQEEIWYNAKCFFEKHFKQHLDIPPRTKYAGRFVQYPKSQSLLNLEDLKQFTSFFAAEFYPNESVPFSFFKERLETALLNLHLTKRTWELFQESQKREKCFQQVYEHFNAWDGATYVPKQGRSGEEGKLPRLLQKYSVLLILEGDIPKFYLIDRQSGTVLQETAVDQLFLLNSIIVHHKGLFIFSETDYPEEYEAGRFILRERCCYILVDKLQRISEYTFLESFNQGRFEVGSGKILYAYKHEKEHHFFDRLVQIGSPVKLNGGIRASKSREFLEGFGPTIISDADFRVIYDYMSCEYNSSTATSGTYKVRVDNFRDIEFRIVKPISLSLNIESRELGWNLQQYTIDKAFDIEGLTICTKIRSSNMSIERQWIYANLQGRGDSGPNNHAFLKAINNSKDYDDCKSLWKSRRTQGG